MSWTSTTPVAPTRIFPFFFYSSITFRLSFYNFLYCFHRNFNNSYSCSSTCCSISSSLLFESSSCSTSCFRSSSYFYASSDACTYFFIAYSIFLGLAFGTHIVADVVEVDDAVEVRAPPVLPPSSTITLTLLSRTTGFVLQAQHQLKEKC